MMPYQGAGAGQAIEVGIHCFCYPTITHYLLWLPNAQQDAYVLARILEHPSTNRDTLVRALEVYDAVRRPFAQMVAAGSEENGLAFTLSHPEFVLTDNETEEEKMKVLKGMVERVVKNWSWAWQTNIEDDVQQALAMLD